MDERKIGSGRQPVGLNLVCVFFDGLVRRHKKMYI